MDSDYKIFSKYLKYDPDTGIITWKISPATHIPVGSEAGGTYDGGYGRIKFNGISHTSHRIAWLLHYKQWPKDQIDHINRVRNDNRILNLREVTNSQNKQNSGVTSNCESGFRGVTKSGDKWLARITPSIGKRVTLGRFNSPEEASEAYINAKQQYHII